MKRRTKKIWFCIWCGSKFKFMIIINLHLRLKHKVPSRIFSSGLKKPLKIRKRMYATYGVLMLEAKIRSK